MSNLWVNIKFGNWYLQIGREEITFRKNRYTAGLGLEPWFKVWQFFGYSAFDKKEDQS